MGLAYGMNSPTVAAFRSLETVLVDCTAYWSLDIDAQDHILDYVEYSQGNPLAAVVVVVVEHGSGISPTCL
jgi:hypothetical protein